MKRHLVIAILLCGVAYLVMSGVDPPLRPLGNTRSGLDDVPGFAVTPNQAVQLAVPHLKTSYSLRRRYLLSEQRNASKPPMDWVTLKDDTYFIVRDNHPAINAAFDIPYAVQVDAHTGAVKPPRPKTDDPQ